MTTPERLRRRQWIETLLLLATVILVVGSNVLQDREDDAQTACLAQQVKGITDALEARSDSTARLNDATAAVLDSFVQAAAKSKPGQSEAERQRNSAPIIQALQKYAQVRDEVRQDRQDNPFPPYPTGKCD